MMGDVDRVRENRLRRMAARQGLRLVKSPRRDRYADGYGTYRLESALDGDHRAGDAPAHTLASRCGGDLGLAGLAGPRNARQPRPSGLWLVVLAGGCGWRGGLVRGPALPCPPRSDGIPVHRQMMDVLKLSRSFLG